MVRQSLFPVPHTKHFVNFLSPGGITNVVTSTFEIPSWDITLALEMSSKVVTRHKAKPYAFFFTTTQICTELNISQETAKSSLYYLGGKVETLEEIRRRNNPIESDMLSDMIENGWNRILINKETWKIVRPLEDEDIVLN
jgi:hypothetical protein